MTRLVILILSLLVFSGCMSRPQMSRAEYMALTTREYSDITPEQLYTAAEAMFEFSSPGGYRYAHHDGGMQAVESGFGGARTWSLNVSKVGAGVRLQVGMTAPGAPGFAPVMVAGGAMGIAAAPGGAAPVVNTVTYDAFWARLEYMLGKRADWMTCAEVRDRIISGVVWGGPSPLCDIRLMDPLPAGPAIKPR